MHYSSYLIILLATQQTIFIYCQVYKTQSLNCKVEVFMIKIKLAQKLSLTLYQTEMNNL